MQIGLKMMDPMIARAMQERLNGSESDFLSSEIDWPKPSWKAIQPSSWQKKRAPGQDELVSYKRFCRRGKLHTRRKRLTFVVAVMGFILSGASSLPILFWLVPVVMCLLWINYSSPQRQLQRYVSLEEMRAVFPLLSLNRAERVYCDTILLIAGMETEAENQSAIRGALGPLNSLLESSRLLERQRKTLLPMLGLNPVRELETEQARLSSRLRDEKDLVTRQALEKNQSLLATRLENARTFEQTLNRLNAQQETLVQGLASAQTAIARMQFAPGTQADVVSEELTEIVDGMSRQVVSLEKAVEEVLTLRA